MFSTQSLSEEHSLIGTWKSDEQKTLASIHSVEGITKEAIDLFENDFFGKLLIHYKTDEYRNYIPGETDDLEEFNKYYPYKVLKKYREYIEISSYSALLEDYEVVKHYWEKDCYYVYTSKWQFKEYFCKVE